MLCIIIVDLFDREARHETMEEMRPVMRSICQISEQDGIFSEAY
jgi:hypothetical protein